jgi:SAM-dependent methyltransferase/uncharacterized protein YbaR (Trm112 family)
MKDRARTTRTERVEQLIACPACHSDLVRADGGFRCKACGASYRIEDATPVLISAEVAFLEHDVRWIPPPALRRHARVKRVIDGIRRRVIRPPVFKSKASRALCDQFVESFTPGSAVLNVGSGKTDFGPDVINLEIAPGPGVDVVGVAESLPIASGSCDGMILMAVLEHVHDANRTLSEARRVLRPGGRLLVDVPFIQGYHASPGDYRRYTEQGLCTEMERFGFAVEGSGVAIGPASAMAWVTSEFLALLVSGRSAMAYRVARNITALIALPIKYADYWLEAHPMASRIPSAVWAIGRVPADGAPSR